LSGILDLPEHWLKRAAEARRAAEGLADPAAKIAMLLIAENYEKVAKRAEAREVGIGTPGHDAG
jgi:hypothetical protein